MIIYNKYYQNLLNINTEKYINISQRPIKGGKNGYGKEYLIISNYYYFVYEGEYLNYKRNGKGKEYFLNGNLKFEGEYLNGYKIKGNGYNYQGINILKLKINSPSKEYYNNGN